MCCYVKSRIELFFLGFLALMFCCCLWAKFEISIRDKMEIIVFTIHPNIIQQRIEWQYWATLFVELWHLTIF